jgi:hypothetical protein
VPATRPIICLTERSRVGEASCPRKYFWATMFVAFCDHVAGNSTSSWRNEPTAAVRDSHSTMSNGCTPACVNRRRTVRASPERGSLVSVVCGVCSISKLLPPPRRRIAKIVGRRWFRAGRMERLRRSRNVRIFYRGEGAY